MSIHVDCQVKGLDKLRKAANDMAKRREKNIRRALALGALSIQREAQKSLTANGKTGEIYPSAGDPTKPHQASAPGEAPSSDTGHLRESVRTVEIEDGYKVIAGGEGAPYAKFLEFGTASIAPRPFMVPAWRNNLADIKKAVREAQKS